MIHFPEAICHEKRRKNGFLCLLGGHVEPKRPTRVTTCLAFVGFFRPV